MTQEIVEIADRAGCSAGDGNSPCETPARESSGCAGLFRRELAAAGLETVAERIAAGRPLELEDAIALSSASLPLLGRILQDARSSSEGGRIEKPWQATALQMDSEVSPTAALPIQRVADAAELPRLIGQPLTDWETFCRTLLATRGEVGTAGSPVAWHPAVTRPPDEDCSADGCFTGSDVLRAVALARLLLPANVQVVAPLATLGPKLAHVALEFGAASVGFVAMDGHAPDHPLVADPSVLDELLGSCLTTALEEEPKSAV